MDSVINPLARELADAIAAAVTADARVEACRAKAREAGYELRVSLDVSVGFARPAKPGETPAQTAERRAVARVAQEMTSGDRRFLKSLRIAADETIENKKEVE